MMELLGLSAPLLFGQVLIGLSYAMMSLGVAIIFGTVRIGNFVQGAMRRPRAYGAWL